jgi:hypothetical protein
MMETKKEGYMEAYQENLNPKTRYILCQDDDGHWYVIPSDKEDEFYDWVDKEDPKVSLNYAEEVGGSPSLVTFTEYEIE